jgi:hypothetical protein
MGGFADFSLAIFVLRMWRSRNRYSVEREIGAINVSTAACPFKF